jgi:hypothetical protein
MALTNATTLADYGSGIGTQGATLKVDANNQRVGIGTLTPAETLDVVGNMAVEGDISVTGTISYEDVTNVDSVGLGTFRNGLHVTGGSVGIGTTNPDSLLHLKSSSGNVRHTIEVPDTFQAFTNYSAANSEFSIGYIRNSGSDHSFRFCAADGLSSGEIMRIDSANQRVGIGTTNPQYKLNVTSQLGCTYSGALRHLVNIDSNGGKSYWYNGTPTNTAYILGDSGNAYFAGNVGIGTDNPTKILHLSQNSDIAIRMHAGNANVNARSWEITVGGNPSNNAEMVFRTRGDDGTGGSECARITRSGVIKLPSGGGIDFSADDNSSGMTSELLDDYEEGTFTITLANSVTIHTQTQARYVKIGSMVMVTGQFRINDANGGAAVVVNNLPFVSLNTVGNDGGFSPGAIRLYQYPDPGGYGNYTSLVQKNDTNLYFYYSRASDTDGSIAASSNGYIAFSCVYHTAA